MTGLRRGWNVPKAAMVPVMIIINSMNLTATASFSYRKHVMVYPRSDQSCSPLSEFRRANRQSAAAFGCKAMDSLR